GSALSPRRYPTRWSASATLCLPAFFFPRSGAHRALHSFPTRRSSDLQPGLDEGVQHVVDRLGGHTAQPLAHHADERGRIGVRRLDRKSTRLNSSHVKISYAVFCLKKKKRRSRKPCAKTCRTGLRSMKS